MKRFWLCFILACFAFLCGTGIFAFWIFYGNAPDAPPPELISLEENNFWQKEILGRFKEESFQSAVASVDESYRFILLPTFDAPVSVRIQRSGDERFLVTKKLSGVGGYGLDEMGTLSYEKTRPFTEEEWRIFISLLDQSDFWNLPRRDKNDLPTPDGATWNTEAVKTVNIIKFNA